MPEPLPNLLNEQTLSDLSEQGLALYNAKLKPTLEPQYNGQVVAVHLDSSDYEVAASSTEARRRLRHRQPEGIVMTMDIGLVDADDPLTLRMLGAQLIRGRRK